MKKFKKLVSALVGGSAAIIVASEVEPGNTTGVWVQIAAVGVLAAILAWNGMFRGVLYDRK